MGELFTFKHDFKKRYGIHVYYACCFGILILYTPSVIYLEDNHYNLCGQFILTDILMSKNKEVEDIPLFSK